MKLGLRWLAVTVCAGLLLSGPAWGRHHHSQSQKTSEQKSKESKGVAAKKGEKHEAIKNEPAKLGPEGQHAAELLRTGVAAIESKDYSAAYKALSELYQLQPLPEVLYQLGVLAQAEGRLVDAQDLMQRYLADPRLDSAPDSAEQQVAQRILALKRPPSGKLNLIGDRGTQVFMDGRIVGVLPLSRSLLVPPGEHKLRLHDSGSEQEETVSVPAGRVAEVRYTRASSAVLVAVLPAVLLFDEFTGLSQALQESLERTVESALQDEHLSVVPALQALETVNQPELVTCLSTLNCQVALARKCQADYILDLRASQKTAPAGWRFALKLIDTEVGDVAAKSERNCNGCTTAQTAAALTEAMSTLIIDAQSRPRGTLSVVSTPPGAEIYAGERLLGRTPYQGTAWAGTLALRVSLKGYDSEEQRVLIFDRQTSSLKVALAEALIEPPPAPLLAPAMRWERAPRPRLRIVIGGVFLGAAVLMLGFGGSALSVAENCVEPADPGATVCRTLHGTTGVGSALVFSGAFLGLGGALLIGLPGPYRLVTVDPLASLTREPVRSPQSLLTYRF